MSTGNVAFDESVSSNSSDPFINMRPRRIKKHLTPDLGNSTELSGSATQPSTSLSDAAALDCIIHSVARFVPLVCDTTLNINELHVKQIIELKQKIVADQSVVINIVVSRLNFLLSMFNIDEVSVPLLTVDSLTSDVTKCSKSNLIVQSEASNSTQSTVAQSYSIALQPVILNQICLNSNSPSFANLR